MDNIERGDLFGIDLLTTKSTEELIAVSQTTICKTQKQSALQIILERYKALVISIASDYMNKGVDFDDLIQEGQLGLINAIEKFDLNKDTKLATYARYWIKHYCRRVIDNQATTIRIPVYQLKLIHKMAAVREWLSRTLGREPSYEEIADKMGLPIHDLHDIIHIGSILTSISLETATSANPSLTIGGAMKTKDPSPYSIVAQNELRAKMFSIFERYLTNKEINFLFLQFGIRDCIERTNADIGELLGLTRERPRQINKATIRVLREIPEMQELAMWYL